MRRHYEEAWLDLGEKNNINKINLEVKYLGISIIKIIHTDYYIISPQNDVMGSSTRYITFNMSASVHYSYAGNQIWE